MKWYARGCTVCNGDLHDDVEIPGNARCLMCGRTYAIPRSALQVVGAPDLTGHDVGDQNEAAAVRLARSA